MTDQITALVRQLIESEDIEEVRRLRQELHGIIHARMEELRKRAAGLENSGKTSSPDKKSGG